MRQKVIFAAIALICLVVGYGVAKKMQKPSASPAPLNDCASGKLQFLNPELACGSEIIVSKKGYAELKSDLQNLIQDRTAKGDVSSVSLYFRDLQNGPTLGIDEHVNFSPASLLKLPMLLTYYQLAADRPGLLDTKLVYKGNIDDPQQYYAPKQSIQEGNEYTINDMLGYMIKYSDNHSYTVLRQYLQQLAPGQDPLSQTFVNLGIVDPKNLLDQTVSVKTYASIFIQLYNGSFFDDQQPSQDALNLLTQVDFKDGIVRGVPAEIKVAHKFGERTGFDGDMKQLHDCGIVYYPKNPYLLCIMTRGHDFSKLSEVIGQISDMVYKEFDSRKL